MYIKEVVMDGFKCYSEKTTIKNIDKSFTAITGMNGSGKSNILDAIIFVFDLETNKNMRVSSLKELINIHRNECTVTLYLSQSHNNDTDNSNNNDHDTLVVISRYLNKEGKSKYKMNNHNCTKSTIESFCKSNNISNDFIVMQGHITKILNMKPVELKSMIEESCGIRNYSLEKDKSLELLEKKEIKIKEIQEYLKKNISPFFNKLKKEKEIYEINKEKKFNRDKFTKIYEIIKRIITNNNINNEIKGLSENIINMNKYNDRLLEINTLVNNDNEKILYDLKNNLNIEKNKIEEYTQEINEYKIKHKKNDFNDILCAPHKKDFKLMLNELREKENILSKELLNDNLSEKIEELEKSRNEKMKLETELKLLENEEKRIRSKINFEKYNNPTSSLKTHNSNSNNKGYITDVNNTQFINTTKFTDENKMLFYNQIFSSMSNDLETYKNKIKNLQYLKSKIIYPKLKGQYKEDNLILNFNDGVYGTVDENFELKDNKYYEAIFTILGGRAKFVICRDDVVASEIIKKTDKTISCIPLNKIITYHENDKQFNNTNTTNNNSNFDSAAAINFISYNRKYEKAFIHLFSGFYIFENKEEARNYCYKYKKITVTLDGTVYDPKGTLTGGKSNFKSEIIRSKDIEILENEIREIYYSYFKELKDNNHNSFSNSGNIYSVNSYSGNNNRSDDLVFDSAEFSNLFNNLKSFLDKSNKINSNLASLQNKIILLESLCNKNNINIKEEIENTRNEIYKITKEEKEYNNFIIKKEKILLEKKEEDENYNKNIELLKICKENYKMLESQIEILEEKCSGINSKVLEEERTKLVTDVHKLKSKIGQKILLLEKNKDWENLEELLKKFKKECIKLELELNDERLGESWVEYSECCEDLKIKISEFITVIDNNIRNKKDHDNDLENSESNDENFENKSNEKLKKSVKKSKNFKYSNNDRKNNIFFTNNSYIPILNDNVKSFIDEKFIFLKEKLNDKEINISMNPENFAVMFDLLEKHTNEIINLEEKINKLVKDKEEIIKSIRNLNEMGIKEFNKAFVHININLKRFLSYFLKISDIYITNEYEIKVIFSGSSNSGNINSNGGNSNGGNSNSNGDNSNSGNSNYSSRGISDNNSDKSVVNNNNIELYENTSQRHISSLNELSGGQRSLIALCLIFSMLTYKPAPFYIFDEIDAALDLNYTQSIGEIIKNEFKGAQFIVISLKNNMFDNANRIFKVFIQDHKSKVCQIK